MDGFSERPFDEERHSSPFFARQRRAPAGEKRSPSRCPVGGAMLNRGSARVKLRSYMLL